jgi:hypothetical protein
VQETAAAVVLADYIKARVEGGCLHSALPMSCACRALQPCVLLCLGMPPLSCAVSVEMCISNSSTLQAQPDFYDVQPNASLPAKLAMRRSDRALPRRGRARGVGCGIHSWRNLSTPTSASYARCECEFLLCLFRASDTVCPLELS